MRTPRIDTEQSSFEPIRRRSGRRTPCGKKVYRNESEALDAAKHLRRSGLTHQRAYQCTAKNCSAWHLSTKPEFDSRVIARFLATAPWPFPSNQGEVAA